jgi:uncharacterized coiled-coil protein SlyX
MSLFNTCLFTVLIQYAEYFGSPSKSTSVLVHANESYQNKINKKNKPRNNTGFYYGIRDDIFFPDKSEKTYIAINDNKVTGRGLIPPIELDPQRHHNPLHYATQAETSSALADILGETLLELREMREVIAALREEMQSMKEDFSRHKPSREDQSLAFPGDSSFESTQQQVGPFRAHEKNRVYEMLGMEIEKWALSLLQEKGEDSGWKEIKCNSMMNKKFNKRGQTRCFIKVINTLISMYVMCIFYDSYFFVVCHSG